MKEDNSAKQYGIQPYIQNVQTELPSTFIRYIDPDPEEKTHLRDYLLVVVHRKKIVLAFLAAIILTTVIVTLMMVPLYKSTAVIKIDKDSPSIVSLKGLPTRTNEEYYQTQYEILKSQTLAEKVIMQLGLDKNKDFILPKSELSKAYGAAAGFVKNAAARIIAPVMGNQRGEEKGDAGTPRGETPLYLINSLISRLEVVPVKNSQLVQVSFTSQDPQLALDITNAVADSYIQYDLESRIDSSREARDFLQKQIELTKAKVEHSEKVLNQYASKNEIIFLNSERDSILAQKLAETSTALNGVMNERMQKEALYREIRESGSEIPAILNNPLIQGLKKDHATLEAEYFNLAKTFTPDYPQMKNLKSQITSIEQRIEKEKSDLMRSVYADYSTALKKEAYLRTAVEAQQRKVLDFQDKASQYQTYKREVDVNKELHNSLLQKLNEVGVAAMSTASSIQVMDKPRFPRRPYKPDIALNLFLSVIFGCMGGVGLAFLVEYFDNTVKDTKAIEKTMNLPSLGMIPHQQEFHAAQKPRLVHTGSMDPLSEAFRSIGTFILLSSASAPPRSILVTSPGEKEGKSTVCTNIAIALTESLGNGLIIDADLRKPRLHTAFDVDNKTGLSTYLSGNIAAGNQAATAGIIRPTPVKGLSIIPSGPPPPNPAKLLFSSRMKELLDSLHESFRFVIIDAPPIMGMPDSVLLSRLVDGTILVVKAGETPKYALSSAKQIFRDVNTNLLGVVLNGVRREDIKYGYYSHYFSSYFREGHS